MFNKKVKKRLFTRRALVLGGLKAGVLAVLTTRLYYLQIVKESEYKTFSDSNRIRLSLIPPLRGRILDRAGRMLAMNKNYYRILLDPTISLNREQTIQKLIGLLELSEEEVVVLRKRIEQHRSRRPLMLYEHLTWRQLSRVEFSVLDLPGISIDVGQMRYFPMRRKSPHVIGYLGPVSDTEIKRNPLLNHPDFKIGINGIEQSYDTILRGRAGIKRMEVNAHGVPVSELSRDEGKPGQDIYLTLDKRLQSFASERLKLESGSAIVVDVANGDILAMASTPGFDPNQFTYGVSHKAWSELINHADRPLTNKVLSNQYPPGSTFKLVVGLAALKDGVDPEQTVYCPGYVTLGRRRFHCWKREGHGNLGLVDAIKNSCNAYFYTVAKRIGVDNIEQMAKVFGLGELHDIGVAEQKPGRIPSREWKQAYFKEAWQLGDTLNLGIGQGSTLATPLQLSLMVARVASGMDIKLRLTKAISDGTSMPTSQFLHLPIPDEHLDLIREGMRRVVNVPGGTAFGSRIIPWQFQMAGKTGTSQVISRKLSPQELAKLTPLEAKRLQNHALFVGFAPVYEPRYAIAVVVEHGASGSKAAAPIARDILTEAQNLKI